MEQKENNLMEACFSNHLPDDYVDLSDLYVVLSYLYLDFSLYSNVREKLKKEFLSNYIVSSHGNGFHIAPSYTVAV